MDIDPGHGGDDSLFLLTQEHGELPTTIEVLTGGGGRHLYFEYPSGLSDHLKSTVNLNGHPGLDIRADSGYVVAPGSLHGSGRRYEWEVSAHPDDISLAATPAWIVDLLVRRRPIANATQASDKQIAEGGRNNLLTSLAGSMRHRGMSQATIEAALLIENSTRFEEPLAVDEVRKIAVSVANYPAGKESTDGSASDCAHLLSYPLSDLGNAQRLVAMHGNDLRHCLAHNSWYFWDEARWRQDHTGEADRRMKQTILSLHALALTLLNKEVL